MSNPTLERELVDAERNYERARMASVRNSSRSSFHGSTTALIELEHARNRVDELRRALGRPTLNEEAEAAAVQAAREITARQRARHERRRRERTK